MARIYRHGMRTATLAGALLMAGCAVRTAPPPLASLPAPPAPTRPQPPAGASANQSVPPRTADGGYRTINSALSPAATIWHVRSALNVAALGCRGAQETALIANYNAVLASKKTLLKTAFAQTEAEARKGGGTGWRDTHDREMTQTYNFFAQPPAKAAFCETAAAVAAEAAAIPPMEFGAFAGPALARLEAPFLAFYRAYDAYRVELAAWDAGTRAAPATALAAVTVPVAAASPAPAAPENKKSRKTKAEPAAQLAYAPMDTILAWSGDDSAGNRRLASSDIERPRP